MRRKLLHILAACLAAAAPSCSDDAVSAPEAASGEYEIAIPADTRELTVPFPGLSAPLAVTLGDDSWLSCETGEWEDGGPCVRFISSWTSNEEVKRQNVTVRDSRGNVRRLLVETGVAVDDGYNDVDPDFLTNWEKQDTVLLYIGGRAQPVNTPWNPYASESSLLEEVGDDVKKADGWEMAFSTLGNKSLDRANYFGLYNKYTGILRVFYFVDNATTTGSEYCLEVNMGGTSDHQKFPFYHALNYSIPTSHTRLDNMADLLGVGLGAQTFKTFVSPYITSSSSALNPGWIAFDVDASGYCPSGYDWKKSKESMTLQIKTSNTFLVDLCGGLTADLGGNFTNIQRTTSTSASSGVSKLFSTIGKAGSISGPVGAVTKALTGTDIKGTINTIAGISNVIAKVVDRMTASSDPDETFVESMAGRLELNMTGKLDLAGKITSQASNECPQILMKSAAFLPSHFGEGVWGLAQDPVVYVVGDKMIGNVRRFNLACGPSGYSVSPKAPELYNVRMISFLDPMSIKLQFNEKVLTDISDIEVLAANFGVYPDEEAGHTSGYVDLLGLDRPTVKITDQKSGMWHSYTASNSMKYFMVPANSVLSPELDETEANSGLHRQKGSDHIYYGRRTSVYGKSFISNPQILFPYASDSISGMSKMFDGTMPDLVVNVVVKFKAKGHTYLLARRFLPQIKVIGGSEVEARYKELKSYQAKCSSRQAVDKANGKDVRHTTGNATVERAVRILDAVLK